MVKQFLVFVAAMLFFRVLDAEGTSSALLMALGTLLGFGAMDMAALVARKVRGAVPTKGGRA